MNWRNEKARLGGWVENIWQQIQSRGADDDIIRQATDYVVEIADPAIRQAKHYRQALRLPITDAMAYFQSLLENIPGPVILDRSQYHDIPLVKALFASPDELDEVIQRSPEVDILRRQGYHGEVVAMLTMQQNERTIFGYKQDGELLLRDVRQQAVSFSDHRIVAPAANLNATKNGIVNRGLEVLATFAMERITTLRAKKAELEGKKEYLKGMMKILGGKSHMHEMFAAPVIKQREELRKAEKILEEVNQELEDLRKKISLPEQSLGHLEEVFRKAEELLRIHNQCLRLNWMGVRVDDEPGSEGNDITLAEFSIQEELRRSAVLVTIPMAAASNS